MADSPFLQSVERRRPGSSMRNYVTRTLPHSSAVVVSNRAPHEPRPEGGFARGAGGVVTALLTLAEVTSADWVSCVRTEAERNMVEQQGETIVAPLGRSTTKLHYVNPTREQYHMYYSVIANPVLWFIQHYLWNLAQEPNVDSEIHTAWADGYVEVNRQVARRVVEVAATTRLVCSHSVLVEERKLREWRPEHLIVLIDRTEPSKNIVRGFLAYEKLLDHHPELKGHVQFWAFLQPSRQDVAVYRDYLRLIRSTAHRINRRYGGGGWSPIRLDFGESVRKAMAALRNFDVLLVNP